MVEMYIQGVVIDKKTATPIENARVYQNGTELDGVLTNENGEFTIDFDENGHKSIIIEADGFKNGNFPTLKGVNDEVLYTCSLSVDSSYQKNTTKKTEIPTATKKNTTKVHKAELMATRQGNKDNTNKSDNKIFWFVIIVLFIVIGLVAWFIIEYNKKTGSLPLGVSNIAGGTNSVADLVAPVISAPVPVISAPAPVISVLEYR